MEKICGSYPETSGWSEARKERRPLGGRSFTRSRWKEKIFVGGWLNSQMCFLSNLFLWEAADHCLNSPVHTNTNSDEDEKGIVILFCLLGVPGKMSFCGGPISEEECNFPDDTDKSTGWYPQVPPCPPQILQRHRL